MTSREAAFVTPCLSFRFIPQGLGPQSRQDGLPGRTRDSVSTARGCVTGRKPKSGYSAKTRTTGTAAIRQTSARLHPPWDDSTAGRSRHPWGGPPRYYLHRCSRMREGASSLRTPPWPEAVPAESSHSSWVTPVHQKCPRATDNSIGPQPMHSHPTIGHLSGPTGTEFPKSPCLPAQWRNPGAPTSARCSPAFCWVPPPRCPACRWCRCRASPAAWFPW